MPSDQILDTNKRNEAEELEQTNTTMSETLRTTESKNQDLEASQLQREIIGADVRTSKEDEEL